jgi:hypothetical protein
MGKYQPQVNDYVKWENKKFEGWVYFVDHEYITIELYVKPKPKCNYTKRERHKNIHCLLLCYPYQWSELTYVKSRKSVYDTDEESLYNRMEEE